MAKIMKQAASGYAGADMKGQPEEAKGAKSAAVNRAAGSKKASGAQSEAAKKQDAKYVPTPEEQEVLDKLASQKSAPLPFVHVAENGLLCVDHEDELVAEKLLQNALATSDPAFAKGLMEQLKTLANSNGLRINFLLSVVKGVEPRDQLETMLALQMAAVHLTFVNLYPLLMETGLASQQADLLSALNKLAKTFTGQMDALKNFRTKGEQKVVVQYQNVNVAEGAQAIVGDVHQQAKGAVTPASSPPALAPPNETPMEIIGKNEKARVIVNRKSAK